MYTTIPEIKKSLTDKAYKELSDDDNDGVIDEAMVNEKIERADAEIDSYCRIRYTVPFANPAPIIKTIACDIAIYYLFSRKFDEVPKTYDDLYSRALRKLRDIADGSLSLEESVSEGGSGYASAVVITG